jgi:hypothetical protein
MAEWRTLTDVDLTPVQSAGETVQDITAAVAAFLTGVSALIRVISMFVTRDIDVIRSLVDAALATLEAMITGLLHNNGAFALHINLDWDPDWTYSDKDADGRSTGKANWKGDGDLPWTANGIDGWLLDIAASTRNPANIFRPLTDSNTTVTGFIYVVGSTSVSNMSTISDLLALFKDWSDFEEIFDSKRLDGSNPALMRAQHALLSEAIRMRSTGPAEMKKDLETSFVETLTDWSFRPGSFPKWASVPLARMFPPIYNLLRRLEAVIDALRQSRPNVVANLANLLMRKAALLAELAEELGDIIQQLLSLATLLESGSFIWIQVGPLDAGDADSANGGMTSFINQARGADGKPELGDKAVFGGVVGVVTAENPASSLTALFDMLGISIAALAGGDTGMSDQIEDTIADAASYF